MIIKNIRLKNFRKFKDEFIEFPNGVIGVVGNNGAGKSTIVEAVSWALYGQSGANTDKELIKREGAEPHENCIVELEFVFKEKNYKIIRALKGTNEAVTAEIYLAGGSHPEATRTKEVTDYVTKLLGMDYASFNISIFAKQKELNALSDKRPGERKKMVLRMLNINRIDDAIQLLRADRREKQNFVDARRGMLRNEEELVGEIEKAREEEKAKKSVVDGLKKEEDSLKKEYDKTFKMKGLSDKRREEFLILDKKGGEINSSLEEKESKLQEDQENLKNLNEKLNTLNKLRPLQKRYQSVKKLKKKLDEEKNKATRQEGVQESIKNLTSDIKKQREKEKIVKKQLEPFVGLDKEAQKLDLQLKKKEEEQEKLSNEKEREQTNVDNATEQLEELGKTKQNLLKKGKNGKCPTCGKIIGKDFAQIKMHFKEEEDKFNKKIKAADTALRKLEEACFKVRKEVIDLKSEKRKIDSCLTQQARLSSSLKEIKENIKGFTAQLRKEKQALKKLGKVSYDKKKHERIIKEHEDLETTNEEIINLEGETKRITHLKTTIAKNKREIKKLRTELTKLDKQLKLLDFKQEEYDRVIDLYENTNKRYNEKRLEVKEAEKELAEARKDVSAALKEKQKQETIKKEIEKDLKTIEFLNELEDVMNKFKLHLISRIRPMLSSRASELLNRLTEGKYSAAELDENYDLQVADEGKFYTLKRFSGGEEDLANLCLRIAISRVISEKGGADLNFIVLDEIFGSQDSQRKINILQTLNDLSSQFKQIILITHTEEIKDTLPNILNVWEGEDKISHAKFTINQ